VDEIKKWENEFITYLSQIEFKDSSHDLNHFKRVWLIAKEIIKIDKLNQQNVDELVILAACYFHDIVSFKKDDPKRSKASYYASLKVYEILENLNFPKNKLDEVSHCILTHSYSANITPKTIEAKIVQDADRMEAIGAIGLARVFYVSGQMNRSLFHSSDPFAESRELDDKEYAVDHFFVKLLKLKESMHTTGAKLIAAKREKTLLHFLKDLRSELIL
jgi:uncharacterized protein